MKVGGACGPFDLRVRGGAGSGASSGCLWVARCPAPRSLVAE